MFIQPIYNILLLPDITYYFKKDFFAERSDKLQPGEDVLFMMLRTENEGQTFQADDFYPIGLSAKIENISDEDVIQVHTIERGSLKSCH